MSKGEDATHGSHWQLGHMWPHDYAYELLDQWRRHVKNTKTRQKQNILYYVGISLGASTQSRWWRNGSGIHSLVNIFALSTFWGQNTWVIKSAQYHWFL
jgi:predicted alpha/beta-fold hydrolase